MVAEGGSNGVGDAMSLQKEIPTLTVTQYPCLVMNKYS